MNINRIPIFLVIICTLAYGQATRYGLEGQKVNSIAISRTVSLDDLFLAGTDSNGLYIHTFTEPGSKWENHHFNDRPITAVYAQKIRAGEEEYPYLFAAVADHDTQDSTLVYSLGPEQSYWARSDSGLRQFNVNKIVSFTGFDYEGYNTSQPIFCCANDHHIYFQRNGVWDTCWSSFTLTAISQLYSNDSTLFACGTSYGFIPVPVILKSSDQGQSWEIYTPFPNHIANSITATDDSDTLYVGLNNRVIKSTDAGASWDSTSLRLENVIFTSIIINPLKPNHIYAGGKTSSNDYILWRSENSGETWEQLNPVWNSRVKGINSMAGRVIDNKFELYIATDGDGILKYSEQITNVESKNIIPINFQLLQNYPNPFNPTTTISYSIPEEKFITLKIYDVLGREVSVLVNEKKPAGNYKVEFNANNLSSGVYFYRLTAEGYTDTKKFVLLR